MRVFTAGSHANFTQGVIDKLLLRSRSLGNEVTLWPISPTNQDDNGGTESDESLPNAIRAQVMQRGVSQNQPLVRGSESSTYLKNAASHVLQAQQQHMLVAGTFSTRKRPFTSSVPAAEPQIPRIQQLRNEPSISAGDNGAASTTMYHGSLQRVVNQRDIAQESETAHSSASSFSSHRTSSIDSSSSASNRYAGRAPSLSPPLTRRVASRAAEEQAETVASRTRSHVHPSAASLDANPDASSAAASVPPTSAEEGVASSSVAYKPGVPYTAEEDALLLREYSACRAKLGCWRERCLELAPRFRDRTARAVECRVYQVMKNLAKKQNASQLN
jgi:hypothetical protein